MNGGRKPTHTQHARNIMRGLVRPRELSETSLRFFYECERQGRGRRIPSKRRGLTRPERRKGAVAIAFGGCAQRC